jgi:hypothetical protein
VDIATKIVNHSISVRNNPHTRAHGYHIADERIRLECYYDELDSILKEMENVVKRMGSLWSNVKAICDILTMQFCHTAPVFQTMLPSQYCKL